MVLHLPDSWLNWNLEGLVSDERGKLEVPGEKYLRAKERTNNKLYPHMARCQDLNPGHIGGGKCSHHCASTIDLPLSKEAVFV